EGTPDDGPTARGARGGARSTPSPAVCRTAAGRRGGRSSAAACVAPMDICLIRHAIAAQRDPEQWPDDRDRPLTPKGEQRFRKTARGLAGVVPRMDVVFSSPLERAWRTAAIL